MKNNGKNSIWFPLTTLLPCTRLLQISCSHTGRESVYGLSGHVAMVEHELYNEETPRGLADSLHL